MESRKGNPKATPAPFSTALRETRFFVMNMGLSLSAYFSPRITRIGNRIVPYHFADSGACLRNESLLTIPSTIADNL